MTTHYNIHIVKTKTDLKLTYRSGKFKKLEHLRGTLSDGYVKAIGNLIPPKESDLKSFIKGFEGKIIYTALSATKVVSLFSQFNSEWFAFYSKENQGRKPKYSGADGVALKQIIKYLVEENQGDETAAIASWKFILENWKHLSDFYKKQQDLKIINSKLNVIITELANKHTSNERTFQAAAESESARAFKFGTSGK